MARKIEEIQEEMLTAKENNIHLAELQDTTTVTNIFKRIYNHVFGASKSSSKVAIWRLWIYIVSFCIWTLEVLFDVHSSDVDKKLSELKPHTPRWYRGKALRFQYGFDLIEDTDVFKNEGATDEAIENSKIIKYSAVTELENESRLIIKIATEENNLLSPVNDTQLNAFKAYVSEFKDAGVPITVINFLPDRLRINLKIVRDQLILDANGMNRKTGTFPVNEAIAEFLKELPFNGNLSIQKLEEKILQVKGVNDLGLALAETSWIEGESDDDENYGDWKPIDISTIPISGYFTINITQDNDTKSTIKYV